MSTKTLIIGTVALVAIVLLAIFATPSGREWATIAIATLLGLLIRGGDHVVRGARAIEADELVDDGLPVTRGGVVPPVSILPILLAVVIGGCSGAPSPSGEVTIEYHDEIVYGSAEAAGEIGPFATKASAVVSWTPDWMALEVEFELAIKGMFGASSSMDCLFDEDPGCEVCLTVDVLRHCFWLPSRAPAPPEKPPAAGGGGQ